MVESHRLLGTDGAAQVEHTPMTAQVAEAWNLMGGDVEWSALPTLAELLDVDDYELWVRGLCAMRNAMKEIA